MPQGFFTSWRSAVRTVMGPAPLPVDAIGRGEQNGVAVVGAFGEHGVAVVASDDHDVFDPVARAERILFRSRPVYAVGRRGVAELLDPFVCAVVAGVPEALLVAFANPTAFADASIPSPRPAVHEDRVVAIRFEIDELRGELFARRIVGATLPLAIA